MHICLLSAVCDTMHYDTMHCISMHKIHVLAYWHWDDLELKWPSGRKLFSDFDSLWSGSRSSTKRCLIVVSQAGKNESNVGESVRAKEKKSCIFVGQKWPATRAPSGCYMLPLGSNAHMRPAQGVVAPLCPLATTLGAQQPPAKRFWSIWLPPMGPYIKFPISLGSKTL